MVMSEHEARVYAALWRDGAPSSLQKLAETLEMGPNVVSRAVRSLEEKEIITSFRYEIGQKAKLNASSIQIKMKPSEVLDWIGRTDPAIKILSGLKQ